MYELLLDMDLSGEAEVIIDALRQIADDIENGLDSGTTELGEWAIQEHEDDLDEEDPTEEDDYTPEPLNFDHENDDFYAEEEESIDFESHHEDIVEDFEDPYVDDYRRNRRHNNQLDWDEDDAAWED